MIRRSLFYTQLAALQSLYGFTAMDKVEFDRECVDFASMEDGSLQLLTDLALNDRGGLLLQFSFTQSLDSADNALFFVIQPAGTKQAFISRDGLQVLQDGQPLASYAFSETPDWQPGTPYVMFLHRTAAGGVEVSVWDSAQPAWIALLKADDDILGSDTAQVGLKLTGEQTLTIHDLWTLIYTPDAETAAQAALDAQAAVASILEGYQITEANVVDALDCDGRVAGEAGAFSWDANANEHCDLSLQTGQALAFDFTLSKSADEWAHMAYVMLDANMDDIQMPTKSLGIPLANDKVVARQDGEESPSVPYSNGFELSADVPYSALVVMNAYSEFEISIWPEGDPDLRLSAVINGNNVPSTWLPVEGEQWRFGIWTAEDQQVSITNLVRYTLTVEDSAGQVVSQSEEAVVINNEPAADQPDWMETGMIPNLGEFYIENIHPYGQLDCNDIALSADGGMDFPANTGDTTYECQMDLQEGSGVILEFTYTISEHAPQDAHLYDFAFATGENESQRLIRYMPNGYTLFLKKGDEIISEFQVGNKVTLEPGKKFTLVFIPSANKYFYIWPSENPDQCISEDISIDEWQNYFDGDDPGAWQLRTWVAAGVELQLNNIYQFEAH